MRRITLKHAFRPEDNYFFKYMHNVPWSSSMSEVLDLEYLGGRSGLKFISPLVEYYADEDGHVDRDTIMAIAEAVEARYLAKWNALYATITAEYNPIHNYDLSETVTKSANEIGNNSETQTDSDTKLESLNSSGNSTETDYAFGFNSAGDTGNPSGKFVTATGDIKNNTTTDNFSGQKNQNRQLSVSETETRTRSGNIGVTTTQQMLMQERELWMWDFFNTVYNDADEILTLPVYDLLQI